MNVHDSERMAGLLEAAGYAARGAIRRPPTSSCSTPARSGRTPTTSSTATSGTCARSRPRDPGMQIAVGGCLAQKDRDEIVRRAPWVDVVFGTHNVHALPVLLERARHNAAAQVEIARVARGVPVHAAGPARVGLRRLGVDLGGLQQHLHVLHRARRCAAPSATGGRATCSPRCRRWPPTGVLEVTLLGQNVNSYGVEFGDRGAFAKLLRACGDVAGLERVRFTSPHPRDFTSDVIAAMAETPNVCPQLHMPLQSGSDDVLRADAPLLPVGAVPRDPRRGAGGDPRRRDLHRHHRRVPRRDRRRLRGHPRRRARRRGSPRRSPSSTRRGPARRPPTLPDQVPKAVVQERYERLVALQEEISWAQNRALEGRVVEVLVADGRGPQGRARPGGMSGRARDGRLVHFAPGDAAVRPGDVVRSRSTYGAPHHLVADGPLLAHRRTRAGDAHEAGTAARAARRPGWACRASARPAPLPAVGRLRGRAQGEARGRTTRSPDELAALEAELAEAERRVEHRIDPGPTALAVAVAVLVAAGLAGAALDRRRCRAGRCSPGVERLRPAAAAVHRSRRSAFGVLGSALALADALVGLAWLCAVGCGFSVVNGVWAIWSRQVDVPARRHRPGDRPGARGARRAGAGGVLGADRARR